jgi:saccharopine dehydrogenase-like NADP-dependent oxidoreductase
MRVGVIGLGAVGSRVVRRLIADDVTVVVDRARVGRRHGLSSLGPRLELTADPVSSRGLDALVVATPDQHEHVRAALGAAPVVIATTDALGDARGLLGLDAAARTAGTAVVVGAGFAPGLSCLLAGRLASRMDHAAEIHVAKFGTGGPACARQHHRALAAWAVDWRDGRFIDRPGGSGRELCWFPDPVGAADCYRAELSDPVLLVEAFPDLMRATSRMAATRRDRFTSWLPMFVPPHPEGALGAIRVEVRGERDGQRVVEVLGVVERPAVATAAVAASVVLYTGASGLAPGSHVMASLADPALVDLVLGAGLRVSRFAGTEGRSGW